MTIMNADLLATGRNFSESPTLNFHFSLAFLVELAVSLFCL